MHPQVHAAAPLLSSGREEGSCGKLSEFRPLDDFCSCCCWLGAPERQGPGEVAVRPAACSPGPRLPSGAVSESV